MELLTQSMTEKGIAKHLEAYEATATYQTTFPPCAGQETLTNKTPAQGKNMPNISPHLVLLPIHLKKILRK